MFPVSKLVYLILFPLFPNKVEAMVAQQVSAIQQGAAAMQSQQKAFEADTQAINQRISAVENEVKKDIGEMDKTGAK